MTAHERPWAPATVSTVGAAAAVVVASGSHGNRLDPHVQRYAGRASSMTASEIRALFSVASRPEVVSLAGGMPNLAALPMDDVADLIHGIISTRGASALQYGSGQGDPTLREQILDVVSLVGISCHPDDVIVTTGSQHALDLVARIFLDPGDTVLAEGPSYVGALSTFNSYQAKVDHVPMDAHGLIPQALRERLAELIAAGRPPKFLYTVPSFHNPMAVTLTAERRAEVLAICQSAGVLVLEDDPYGLLGFNGHIPQAIRALDGDGVVYLGSFSKTFAPGLRVGWAVAPHGVREKLVLAAEASVLSPSAFSQLTVSGYLASFPWFDQIKKYRAVYRERRDAMLTSLDDAARSGTLPDGTHWTHPDGGFYVWLSLPPGWDAGALLPRAIAGRVAFVPGRAFYADGQGVADMRLSFCFPPPERIREGIRRLCDVIGAEASVRAMFGGSALGQASSQGSASTGIPSPDLA